MDDRNGPVKAAQRKRKKWLGLDPLHVVITAIVASLPFLLVRVFMPPAGPDTQVVKAPALAASLSDDATEWVVDTLADLPLERDEHAGVSGLSGADTEWFRGLAPGGRRGGAERPHPGEALPAG